MSAPPPIEGPLLGRECRQQLRLRGAAFALGFRGSGLIDYEIEGLGFVRFRGQGFSRFGFGPSVRGVGFRMRGNLKQPRPSPQDIESP